MLLNLVFIWRFLHIFLFWIIRIWAFRSGAERIMYEGVVVIGMIASIVVAFLAPKTKEFYLDGRS